MAARTPLSGVRWFLWMRNDSLRIGTLTGIYLSCVLLAWLLVANYIRALDAYAGPRNIAASAIIIALFAIPALRFHRDPGKLFAAGLTAWTLLTLVYIGAEMFFHLLEQRVEGLQVFMLGAVSYGIIALLDWILLMCVEARHRHMAQARATGASAGSRHRH